MFLHFGITGFHTIENVAIMSTLQICLLIAESDVNSPIWKTNIAFVENVFINKDNEHLAPGQYTNPMRQKEH